ncbi:MAG TPA: YcxB family protein [Chitinophagaceae bacterium]|nr:YcxB family protein [Chitinophagaceae bacterium]
MSRTMKDSYNIKQELTIWDFFKCSLHAYIVSRPVRRLFLFVFIISVLSVILGVLTIDNGFSIFSVIYSFLPVIVLLLFFIVFGILVCFFIYKTKPWLFRNVLYDFTHWGIVRHGEKTDFSKPWRDITRFKETKDFFIFYVGSVDLHVIQKRMFTDEGELKGFRLFLKDKMNM